MDFFRNLAQLENDMVVFTTSDLAPIVANIRANEAPKSETTIVSTPHIEDCYRETAARLADKMAAMYEYHPKFLETPHYPEYWSPAYVLVNISKADFACRAYEEQRVQDDAFAAWIDFGYCTTADVLPDSRRWRYNFEPGKMHLFALRKPDSRRPIFDVVRTGDVYVTGGHMVGDLQSWKRIRDLNHNNLETLMKCGLVDDDQTLLLMSCLQAPEYISVHRIRRWRSIFKDFNDV